MEYLKDSRNIIMTNELTNTCTQPKEVVTVGDGDSIAEAARAMQINHVGCVLVTDSAGRLAGIITERDITRAVSCINDLEKAGVQVIMTREVVKCSPETSIHRAREIMAANAIRHLPIVDDGVAVGMYSIRDVMHQQLIETRTAAEQMAMLSACLKSIDIAEIADMVAREVPKLFSAGRCLVFLKSGSERNGGEVFTGCEKCKCSQECRMAILSEESSDKCVVDYERVPEGCRQVGAESPRMLVNLEVDGLKTPALVFDKKTRGQESGGVLRGRLCLCGLDKAVAVNRSGLYYKGKLLRDILNVHLRNAIQYREAKVISQTDSLTKVGSRRFLEDSLGAECARAARYGHPFSVAILDVDRFKDINDRLGHFVGDEILKSLADCMKSCKRSTDIVARYGGDEFVIIMPETASDKAVVMLERLRKEVERMGVEEGKAFTISCGVTQWQSSAGLSSAKLSGCEDSGMELLREADFALYEAKKAGRNCMRVCPRCLFAQANCGGGGSIALEPPNTK